MIRLSGASLALFVVLSVTAGVMVGTAAEHPSDARMHVDAESGQITIGETTEPAPELARLHNAEHPIRDAPGNVLDWDPYHAQATLMTTMLRLLSASVTAVAAVVYHSPIPDRVWLDAMQLAPVGMIAWSGWRIKTLLTEAKHA